MGQTTGSSVGKLFKSTRAKLGLLILVTLLCCCACFSTSLLIYSNSEPHFKFDNPSSNNLETNVKDFTIKFNCLKIDKVTLNNQPVSKDICYGGHKVELKEGLNAFVAIAVDEKANNNYKLEFNITYRQELKPSEPTVTEQPVVNNNQTVQPASYKIVSSEDLSRKTTEKPLSEYTTEELQKLPIDKKFAYKVVLGKDVTSANLKITIDRVIEEITNRDKDIDEVILNLFSSEDMMNSPQDVGMAYWGVNGEIGKVTSSIVTSNDRSSYKTIIKLQVDDLDAYLKQKTLSETKYGLTENQRRAIYLEVAQSELKSIREADKTYPPATNTLEDWKKHSELVEKLDEQYRREILSKYSITNDIWLKILAEGTLEKWPSK